MRLVAFLFSIAVLFALAGPGVAQERYSVSGPQAQVSARAAGLRLLTWPGKANPQPAPAQRPRQPLRRTQGYSPPAYVPPPAEQSPGAYAAPTSYIPPPAPLAAPQAYAPRAPAALPTSIYAPPPPRQPAAAAPVAALAQAAPTGVSPRFYSVHRPYGDTPDPIPLTPQFFDSPTADLAQPPPPVARPQTTATGRVIRPTPPDPDSASPADQ